MIQINLLTDSFNWVPILISRKWKCHSLYLVLWDKDKAK